MTRDFLDLSKANTGNIIKINSLVFQCVLTIVVLIIKTDVLYYVLLIPEQKMWDMHGHLSFYNKAIKGNGDFL